VADVERRSRWAAAGLEAVERLDLPGGVAAGVPVMELTGNRRFFLEQHRGILSYSTERVDINAGNIVVRVSGEGLELVAMTEQDLRIDGRIDAVELVE
jgi:sporulation protein YqfC